MQQNFPVEKIVNSIRNAYGSNFYKRLWANCPQVQMDYITYEDFLKIPFTKKDFLRSVPSYDYLATPRNKVRRIHSSSGTQGVATLSFYSDKDIEKWAEHLSRVFTMAHLVPGDVFQIIVGYGLFSGGLGFEFAAEKYGLSVIPIGTGNTERQIQFLVDNQVNGIITISSYLPILASAIDSLGIDPRRDLCLKSILIGAEPFNEQTRNKLEIFFGAKIYSVYGMSELEGPGIASECEDHTGMHLFTDSYFAEIIDPQTGELLPYGEEGELVLTTLDRECMPLIRYRTGDITRFVEKECHCGFDFIKIANVKRRIDDMIIVRGVNIYPFQIENVVAEFPSIFQSFQCVIESDDRFTVRVALLHDEGVDRNVIEMALSKRLKEVLLLKPTIEWKSTSFFMAQEGKAIRIIDNRKF